MILHWVFLAFWKISEMYLIDLIRVSSFIFTVSIYHLVTFPKINFLSINYPFYQTIGLNFSWCFLDMTISKKEKLSMKRILFSQSNVFDEFIRWFNEFRNYDRNYESMIFFSKSIENFVKKLLDSWNWGSTYFISKHLRWNHTGFHGSFYLWIKFWLYFEFPLNNTHWLCQPKMSGRGSVFIGS